jgi:hypothetical protein
MMQVCYTEVQRRQEDDLFFGEVAKDMQRHNEGSPDELLADRSLVGSQSIPM